MRPSVYNFIFDNGSNYLLYNASSDEIIVMGEELYRLYMENLGDVENIRRRHPGFYQYLLGKEAIVEDSCSESDSVIAKWKASDARSGTFTITVNPTMDCNMSCWYCYERRCPGTKMGKGVARGVLALIERVCASHDACETILLSFFGGEPLLCFDEIVLPLVREALDICKASGKELRVHFTTNGFLISGEMLESLGTVPVSFQITLDGNSTVHNRNKTVDGVVDTYGRTVSNIVACLEKGAMVTVRLNFTGASLPYFIDVLSDLSDMDDRLKRRMSINFQRVWQDGPSVPEDDLRMRVRDMEKAFGERGFTVVPYSSNTFGRCYADMENSVVVNYDGNVFKCTAREFTPQNREGVICEDGSIAWEDRHADRRRFAYGGGTCRKCRVFPLCHGGCSQCKLESGTRGDACLRGFSASERLQLVRDRVRDILLVYNGRLEMGEA